MYMQMFNHYHRIQRFQITPTKFSTVSAAFLSVTPSLDGVRDGRDSLTEFLRLGPLSIGDPSCTL